MTRAASNALYLALTKSPKLANMTQAEIAGATGIHQSQISRLMSGKFKRISARNFATLCRYADTRHSVQPPISGVLKDTIEAVWDGSKHQEQALVKLLRAAGMLAIAHAADVSRSTDAQKRARKIRRSRTRSRPKKSG
jgi:predicted XRE-type DNA-binding protein